MNRAKRPCAAPCCPALVESGYCANHASRVIAKQQLYDNQRGSSAKRGYDAAWKRFRKWFLSKPEHALCEDCRDKREPQLVRSTEVHHVKKVADYPELRLVESNCRGLCKTCHSARTARGE